MIHYLYTNWLLVKKIGSLLRVSVLNEKKKVDGEPFSREMASFFMRITLQVKIIKNEDME